MFGIRHQQMTNETRDLLGITPHDGFQTLHVGVVARRAAKNVLARPERDIFVKARPALALGEEELQVFAGKFKGDAVKIKDPAIFQVFATLAGEHRGIDGGTPARRQLKVIDVDQNIRGSRRMTGGPG
jgi:hypothetical protein